LFAREAPGNFLAEGRKPDVAFDQLFNLAMMMEWKADGPGCFK
jgi:hypothetical protein